MERIRALLVILAVVLAGLPLSLSLAAPSQNFYESGRDVFDDWQVCRTRAYGQDGFFQVSPEAFSPIIAFESLAQNADIAYSLGQQFSRDYPDRYQRAERIFYFVRDKVRYTPDIDQFRFKEFALNADELALTIEQQGFARGDCEDYAILLAVMYKAAGYRSAIVLAPNHAATLIYLPGYKKATTVFNFNGEPGWIWAEATGRNNPLGWAPESYAGEELAAYEITDEQISPQEPTTEPGAPVTKESEHILVQASPFLGVISLLWIVSMFRRRS